MITQATLRDFYRAQAEMKALEVQLKAAKDHVAKLEESLIPRLSLGERQQRGRLGAELSISLRKSVKWKEVYEGQCGKAAAAEVLADAPTTAATHVVIIPQG